MGRAGIDTQVVCESRIATEKSPQQTARNDGTRGRSRIDMATDNDSLPPTDNDDPSKQKQEATCRQYQNARTAEDQR